MRPQIPDKRLVIAGRVAQFRGVLLVSKKLDSFVVEDGLFRGKGTSLFVFRSQIARDHFAGFDIRLIECIDTDN